jgi:hypothetical protein
MRDRSGAVVEPYKLKYPCFNAAQVRPVGSLLSGTTTFVYRVPENSTGYVLTFKKKKSSESVLRWQMP